MSATTPPRTPERQTGGNPNTSRDAGASEDADAICITKRRASSGREEGVGKRDSVRMSSAGGGLITRGSYRRERMRPSGELGGFGSGGKENLGRVGRIWRAVVTFGKFVGPGFMVAVAYSKLVFCLVEWEG
jgi:hypothetical protein